jgi:molecular chaperone HscA
VPGQYPAPVGPPADRAKRRRPLLIGAAAAVVMLLVAATAGVVWWRHREAGGYHEVSFASGLSLQGGPIPMGAGGQAAASPTTTLTALGPHTAYLAWADGKGLHITYHPLSGGSDSTVQLDKPATSVDWRALLARPDVLLVYSYEYSSSTPPNHLYALDPRSGKALWNKQLDSNDTVSSVGPRLVWQNGAKHRLVGLDPVSGDEKWSREDLKSDSGYLTTRLRGVYGHADNDAAATLDKDAPLALTGTHLVQVASDGSGRMVDVVNGKTVGGTGIAEYADSFVGSGDNIYVVTDDAGYRVSSFSLADPGSAKDVKRPFVAPGTAQPKKVVPCGVGVCVLDQADSDPTTSTVRMIDTTGQRWSAFVSGATDLTRIGDGVLVTAKDAVHLFTGDGTEIPLGTAGAGSTAVRVNGATALLLKGDVTSYPATVAVAGVGLRSRTVKPLGTLDGVRGESCSWNTELIVCPQQSQFQIWKYAG